jgi:hypothetical protein
MFGITSFAEAPFASLGGAVALPKVVNATGVQAIGYIGNVLIWGLISNGQNPNWTAIDNEQTVTWVEVIT